MENETEIWKSHPEYAGIEVSTLGRVRTLDRAVPTERGTWFFKGRVLKQSNSKGGYLKVSIKVDGKWTAKKFIALWLKRLFRIQTICQK